MEWNKEATERHERMAIPPSVSPFAKMQAEKIARKKGMSRVTVKEVEEAEEAYATYFGKEKAQEMKNLLEGKEPVPQMVEELFFDSSEKLYDIKVCPVKYGSQSKDVADGIIGIFRGVKEIFEKEQLEETIAELSRAPLPVAQPVAASLKVFSGKHIETRNFLRKRGAGPGSGGQNVGVMIEWASGLIPRAGLQPRHREKRIKRRIVSCEGLNGAGHRLRLEQRIGAVGLKIEIRIRETRIIEQDFIHRDRIRL